MANDSSFSSASESFDFETQSGVMHLLASVRASGISAAEKNELRDLVFLYSNGGHDKSVRNNLEQKLAQYKVDALAKPKSTTPAKVHEFGTSRPSPAFKASAVSAPLSQPVEKTPTPTPTAEPAREEVSVPVQPAADIPSNLPRENTLASTPEPRPESPQPVEKPVETAVPAQSESSPTQENSLQRIKEIKALVNEQVGNPVNLVDINNDVGREYMSALLDAMKKINSGSSAASAMQRLETAYSGVEIALKDHEKEPKQSESVVSPELVSAPESEPEQFSGTPIPTEQAPTPTMPPVPQFTPVSDNAPAPAPAPAPASFSPEPVMDDRPIVPLAQSEKSTPAQPAPAPIAPEVSTPSFVEEPVSNWGQNDDVEESKPDLNSQQAQITAPAKYQSASLAQSEAKLRTPEDLPSASALETSSVAGDDLFTKQVDDGLNQLLSDWILFKKSGLFGTGPKGTSHPLYQKLKDLQIPLLLAGRFEGATQEIKQSVTDYMNGWRYEQGIIYEQGETFDHYLRRVIRHILDLQKKV